ncbi:hypothetical protein GTA08_BOTSDO11980 [Neofusicoccum parvum]|uniref:Uncharacterized protein n=1 Tax=Neofusicoccum parvum TaxID=310453 RepID=A0ACB5RTW1_9PEZI|nr:hypothetical protein GTA08_BOTSDO11980 [Neofusicoccum parvum]
MGCFGRIGDQEKNVREEQKWDYITLSDFTSSSWKSKLSYLWLWVLSGIAIAVYVADTFTAVNLLAFNKWSSQVDPAIDISVSKWIFTGCIIFSWVLAGFEWLRAFRVMRRGGVADSYLDPLAATLQSSRIYKGGHGWRRFLVFAELTKSKKGVDYIALFVYFQFKSAIRIVVAEGPRQVVNGVTLWAAMKADLLPEGDHAATDGNSALEQFWVNIGLLADQQREQAIILSSMLFTLVIWVISALSLIMAGVLYVLFLWHYVPSVDGTLANYCRRKVDKRLERVVSVKVQKALEKQEKKIRQEEEEANRAAMARMQRENGGGSQKSQKANVLHSKNSRPELVPRKPTLPQLQGLDRSDTQGSFSTLPAYSSQPPTRPSTANSSRPTLSSRAPTLPNIGEDDKRPTGPTRTDTSSSAWSAQSYGSNAPLLGGASDMGESTPPPMPPMPMNFERSLTSGSQQRSYTPQGPPPQARSTPGPMGQNGYYGPPRSNTAFSAGGPQRSYTPMDRPPMQPPMQGRNSPAMGPNGYGPNGFGPNGYGPPPQTRGPPGPGMPMRQNTGYSMNDGYNMPPPGPMRANTGMNSMGRGTPGPSPLGNADFDPYGRQSPAVQMQDAYELQHQQRPMGNNVRNDYNGYNGGYAAGDDDYDPFRAGTPLQQPMPAANMRRSRSPSNASTRSGSTGYTQQPQTSYMAFNPHQNNSTPVSHMRTGSEDDAPGRNSQDRHVSPVYGKQNNSDSQQNMEHQHQRSSSRNFSAPLRTQQPPIRPLQRSATEPMQAQEEHNGDYEQRPSTAGGWGGREQSPEDWRRDAYGFSER